MDETKIFEYMLSKLVEEGLLTEEESGGALQNFLSMQVAETNTEAA